MSEDDTEFRDLIAQTLESNGILGKIRAQLRANIFLALEDQDKFMAQKPGKQQELREFLQSPAGSVAFGLVRDLLEYFELDHSLAVLKPEAGFDEQRWQELPDRLHSAPGLRGKARPLLRDLAANTAAAASAGASAGSAISAVSAGKSMTLASSKIVAGDSKSSGSSNQRNQPSSPEHQPGPKPTSPKSGSSRNLSKTGSLEDADSLYDDLLPMGGSVARGVGAGNANNNNSEALGAAAASSLKQRPEQTSGGGGGGGLDPLSSPQHSYSESFASSAAASAVSTGAGGSGRRSRTGNGGNNNNNNNNHNFQDSTDGGGGAAGISGDARSVPLSDQLNQAGDLLGSDYADDFEDSIGGGGGNSVSAGGGGGNAALASARSLRSQVSDAIEEVIEAEDLTSAADEDPTDVTVDSEMSLAADYVEDAQRIGRSQL